MTVAVAFSQNPAGRAAIRAALQEASLRGAPLVVLVVAAPDEDVTDGGAARRAQTEVAEVVAAVAPSPEVPWRVEVAPSQGVLAETLLDLAEAAEAEVLVLGTRHRTPVGKLILGSTAQRVLLDAPMPVLVVKPER